MCHSGNIQVLNSRSPHSIMREWSPLMQWMGIWEINRPIYQNAWGVVVGDWALYSLGAIAITALGTLSFILSHDLY